MQLKANPDLMKPIPIPKGNKAKVKKTSQHVFT